MSTLFPLLLLLLGCESGPLFVNIQGIEIQLHGDKGLQRKNVTGPALTEAATCLANTTEVDLAATQSRQVLQRTYLLLIRDNQGVRNFEVLTDQHLKGNGDRYYENACIYAILQKQYPQ